MEIRYATRRLSDFCHSAGAAAKGIEPRCATPPAGTRGTSTAGGCRIIHQ